MNDKVYAELSAKGVKFPMVPSDQPWGGRLALSEDFDGNVLYLDRIAQAPKAELAPSISRCLER